MSIFKRYLPWLIDRYFIKQPRVRRFLTALVYGSKDRKIHLCGRPLVVNALRENGYLRASIRTNGLQFFRELPIIIKLAALVLDGDTFVDIGANIGAVSSLVIGSNLMKRDVRGIALEPHPDTFSRLVENVRHLPVLPYNFAVGARSGPLRMVDGAVSHTFTSEAHAGRYSDQRKSLTVECKKLDDIDLGEGGLCLKVDVEGQELEILQGAKELLASNRIRWIYFDGVESPDAIHSTLLPLGYQFFDLDTDGPASEKTFALLATRSQVSP